MLEMNQKPIISLLKPVLATLIGATCISGIQADLTPIGSEFSIVTSLPGDQINSKLSVGDNGGFLVWEGNALDGMGQGISAVRLNANLEPEFEPFVVNGARDGDQETPDVASIGDHGAAFVWEGNGDIYARLMNQDGTMQEETLVNSYTQYEQSKPSVTVMGNGNAVIVWQSEQQDGDRLGVFGQIISQDGHKIGPEFTIPQNTFLNQRSPAVTKTEEGGFMVVWVSEAPVGGLSGDFGVSIWGRKFHYDGSPKGDEYQLTQTDMLASNPDVTLAETGEIGLVFSGLPNPAFQEVSLAGTPDNWAVYAQIIKSDGSVSTLNKISDSTENDQAVPVISTNGNSFMVAWTGFGGAGQGADVYGTILNIDGEQLEQASFLNTNQQSLQYMPTLSSTKDGNYVAVWSSFVGGAESFDLKALRFDGGDYGSGLNLETPQQPYVFGLGFDEIGISWPAIEDDNLAHYEVFIDGAQEAIVTQDNYLSVDKLAVNSRHSVTFSYVTKNGVKSSVSKTGEGQTWGQDSNSDGLPDSFQQTFWGFNPDHWEHANTDSDQDGLSNLEELLAGTNPLNARSVLQVGMEKSDDSYWLVWDTNPGAIYQIQSTGDLKSWNGTTGPKVANGVGERMPITASQAQNIYRVVRLK